MFFSPHIPAGGKFKCHTHVLPLSVLRKSMSVSGLGNSIWRLATIRKEYTDDVACVNLIAMGNGTDFSRAICCIRSMNVTYSLASVLANGFPSKISNHIKIHCRKIQSSIFSRTGLHGIFRIYCENWHTRITAHK